MDEFDKINAFSQNLSQNPPKEEEDDAAFYTEETGWVTVDYQVSEETWNRLDLTFSANGADGTFIGDGSNYTDMYYY